MKSCYELAVLLLQLHLIQVSLTCSPAHTCNPTDCAYSQLFNAESCSCSCQAGFYGAQCSDFNCSSGVVDFIDSCAEEANCNVDIYRLFCPRTCFNCKSQCQLTASDCAFGQVFDENACKCVCNSGFYGTTCSQFNCSSGRSDFLTECPSIADCSQDIYNLFCPQTCFNCSSTCHLTASDCAYGQEFNAASCSCACKTGFFGSTCSQFNCSSGITDFQEVCSTNVDCSKDIYRLFCPQTCFKCIEQCNLTASDCAFGQVFDENACSCRCEAGFFGPTCSQFNCSSGVTDFVQDCPIMSDCSQDIFNLFCPRTCFKCATKCDSAALGCAYGQSRDEQTCQCVCKEGFTGSTCSEFDCSSGVTDSLDECSLIADCSVDIYRLFCPQTCFKCSQILG